MRAWGQLAVLLLAGADPASQLVTGRARVDLRLYQDHCFLGENALLDFCVVNTDRHPIGIRMGGDYRGAVRPLRFKVVVADGAGQVLPDPYPDRTCFGGFVESPRLEPGQRSCDTLSFAAFARIETPGVYQVSATHDLGWPEGAAPHASTRVVFRAPSAAEAARVVDEMQALPTDADAVAGQVARDHADFSALAYDVYVPLLAARAREGEVRALEGLDADPTPAFTRALVSLLGAADREIALQAARAIAWRLPVPRLSESPNRENVFEDRHEKARQKLSARAWVPALGGETLAAVTPFAENDEEAELAAAFLEALGSPGDLPAVVRALHLAITRWERAPPLEDDGWPPELPRECPACRELLRAAQAILDRGGSPPVSPASPAELAVWLVALNDGARPADWQGILGAALRDPSPYVRELALRAAPQELPVELTGGVLGQPIRIADHGAIRALLPAGGSVREEPACTLF